MRNTFNFYDGFAYPTIDTTTLSPEQVSKKIIEVVFLMNHSCPRKVSHSKSSFDKLYEGGETDEYAKTAERSH